jgi:hypothetical protein
MIERIHRDVDGFVLAPNLVWFKALQYRAKIIRVLAIKTVFHLPYFQLNLEEVWRNSPRARLCPTFLDAAIIVQYYFE